ncbi:MAG: hypothetical protein A3K83_06815 [Omnitrophica WOR_2 bacterium RBG_13_44_8b]|nr:MAG: hypothetical protein A3K83_06815 [Omnitrophica WOR_2 bacterium RBG_13_44_8b]
MFFFSVNFAQVQAKTLETAPDFSLQDAGKTTYTLSSYRGKPVLLFFWTTWCPFCRKEMGELKNIYPQLTQEGWELFTIDIQEPEYKVENFMESHGLTFKLLLDKDGQVAYAYSVLGVPTYVLINKKGEIVFKDNYFPKDTYKKLIAE